MTRYRKYNWPQLFEAFEQSQQTQAEFCKQHELNPKYFSLKWAQHQRSKQTAFSKVVAQEQAPVSPEFVIEVGNCTIRCPLAMPIPSFVSLVKAICDGGRLRYSG